MDDYLKDFVQESEDHITDLNNALLDLESDPNDEAAMDRIFRTAHTIKGNCGAMGFTKAADLSHAIEDLLDEMRAGRVAVTPETMDEVFDGVDTLEQMVDEVREQGEPETDPSDVLDTIRGVTEDAPGPDVRIEEPSETEIETTLQAVEGPAEPEQSVYHVRLAVTEDEEEDEGMLVLEALADAFDVLATNPPQNVIRAEDYGNSFDAIISSAIGDDDISAALEAVDQVDEVLVTDVTEYVGVDRAADEAEVDDMEVEELLDSVSEFDDIEQKAEEMAEEEAMEELGEAGTFDEVDLESDEDIEIEGLLEEEELAEDDEIEESDLGEMEDLEPEPEPDDANAVFSELQNEVEQVEYEELEPELEELEFDEFSDEEDMSFDELVGEVEEGEEEDLDAFDSEFDETDDGLDEVDELFEEAESEIEADPDAEEMAVDELIEAAGEDTAEVAEDLDVDMSDLAEADESGTDDAATADSGTDDATTADSDDAATADSGTDDVADEMDELADLDDEFGSEFETDDVDVGEMEVDDAESTADDEFDIDIDAADTEPVEETGTETPSGDELAEIESIRVDVGQVDSLLNQVEELVTSRIRLRRAIEEDQVSVAEDELDELETLTMRMQDTVMDIRLVPLEQVVGRLPRVVRDIARDQGKEIDFAVEGADVEVDRRILSELGDPLMHLVRNAVDHGIEPPTVREEKGKPREGKVRIRARRARDNVVIEIVDDGGGLDTEAIAERAVEEGIRTAEEVGDMAADQIHELIFEPGFTTAEEVTDVSGRGVGMDVVRETVQSLDGSVGVDSDAESGTTIRLRVPVSVAIVRVLFVESGGEEYGIPVKNVDEITRMTATESVDGERVLTHDDQVYPLVELGEALSTPGPHANGDGMLIRVSDDVRQVALHCDEVSRQEEVVIKPYEGLLSGIPGLSGAAVLGEGNVVNILDVETL
jgi:two-component system chemotaxis sensor kinase CheA